MLNQDKVNSCTLSMLTVHSIRSTFRLMNFIVDFFLIYHIMFSDAPVFFSLQVCKDYFSFRASHSLSNRTVYCKIVNIDTYSS